MSEQVEQQARAGSPEPSHPVGDRRPPNRGRRFIRAAHNTTSARLILALGLILTGLAWWFSHGAVQDAAQNRFEFRSHEIETAVVDRMLGYENVLWSGVGLFDASEDLTREQFAEYIATLSLEERWRGIQGIGWAVPLDPTEVSGHEASIRAEGFPDYRVSPAGDRGEYSAIVFLEPFDWRNQRAFGFDMWSNPERRAAMGRARDTGRAATSSMITLVQETDEDVQRGFLTYVPVYEGGQPPDTIEGRRDALLGWVYAPFRMNDLMEGILGSSTNQVDYQIFDGEYVDGGSIDSASLLFDSNPGSTDPVDGDLSRQTTITVQGQPWTMVSRPGESFNLGSEAVPTYIAIGGMIIEALLFYVITALGTLNRRAEAIAEERTAELQVTNDVLEHRSVELQRHALELERSNDELRQFAHVASHDLQEPVRAMAGYSSLISSTYADELDERGQRWLGYINDSATRLSDLIREILQFSTLDQLSRDPTRVDLNHVLHAVRRDLSDLLTTTSAEVVVEDLPDISGDPAQLQQLLTNLIHNAISYRRPDVAPRISIRASAGASAERWRIHVSDNGIGIDPEFQVRIFELFRRVAPREQQTGTGIGLAICRKIVRAHGGDIGVVSAPGRGTEFWFELPGFVPPGREGIAPDRERAAVGSVRNLTPPEPLGSMSDPTRPPDRRRRPSSKEFA